MKKTISVLLAIMMIMLSLLPTMVLAEERDKTYDVTLGEIQQELIDYASIAGSKIVPGTDSYYDYVVNQLLNHSDQKLCEHPHYDLIHAYMAEYKVTYEDYLFCREADDSYKEDITTAEYTTQLKCYNLDTNKFYYFRFFNNSNSNPASSMDISGSIIIDDTYV